MDIEEVWEHLITQLKSYPNVNDSQIDAFFSRLKIQAVSSGFIMLTSQTTFIKEWIETHYLQDIKQALEDIYHIDFFIQIEVDPSQPVSNTIFSSPTPTAQPITAADSLGGSSLSPLQSDQHTANSQTTVQGLDNQADIRDSFQRTTPFENTDTQSAIRAIPQSLTQTQEREKYQDQTQKTPLDVQNGGTSNGSIYSATRGADTVVLSPSKQSGQYHYSGI